MRWVAVGLGAVSFISALVLVVSVWRYQAEKAKSVFRTRTLHGRGMAHALDYYLANAKASPATKIRIENGALDLVPPDTSTRLLLKHTLEFIARNASQYRPPHRSMESAEKIFGIATALLPARIVNEEIGDALEDVRRRIADGRPSYEIKLKIWGSVFWVVFHAATYAIKRLGKAVQHFTSK